MEDNIIRFQGLLELSVIIFLVGFFIGSPIITIVGGILMVINDILEVYVGALNPLFPIILAVILASIISPWYVGIFWSQAVFHVLGIPTAILKVTKGSAVLRK